MTAVWIRVGVLVVAVIELFFLVFFVLAAFGIGSLLLNLTRIRFHSFPEELVFSVAAGYGMIIFVTYALGFLGLLYRQFFLLLFLAALAISFSRVKYLLSQLYQAAASAKSGFKLNVFSILLLLVVFFAIFNMVASLAPPWIYDATLYHLAVPKIYAAEHGFVFLPSIMHGQLLLSSHMLFLAGIVLESGVLANLVNFTFSLLLTVAIYSFCSRFLDKRTGILASAIFATLPIISIFSASANSDLPLAFFAFIGFYAFMAWASDGRVWWLSLSAFMIGLAASTKLTGLSLIPLMAALLFFYEGFVREPIVWQNIKSAKAVLLHSAVFSLVAVASAVPAYMKNFVYAGNPFYPLFLDIFGGNLLSAQMSDSFAAAVKAYGTGVGIPSFLLLPWNMTMYPLKFVEQLGISPLFLAFIPLAFFVRKNHVVKITMAAGFFFLVSWFFTSQALRYALYIFPLFSIVAAFVVISLNKVIGRLSFYLVAAAVAVVLLFSTALLFGANAKQLPVALGLETDKEFFARLHDGNIYAMCDFVNGNVGRDANMLLLYENRGYHCDRSYVLGTPPDQAYINYSSIFTADDYAKRLREIGVTHILVNRNSPIYKPGDKTFTAPIAGMLDSFLKGYGELVHSTGSADLYEYR